MKRSIIVLIAALLFAASCGTVFAEEKKEHEGIEVEAGVKAWYNKWTNKDPDPALGTTKFDATTLLGPAIEVKFPHHFYAEAAYLISLSDYKATTALGEEFSSDRKDLDLAVGYRFIPEVGVFVGYKNVSMDWTVTGVTSGSFDLSGPMFGLRGDVPVSETFSIFASATYLMTKVETKEEGFATTKNDAPGSIFELGVKASFSKELSGTLGYKVESTKEKNTDIKDSFAGLTLGVMYAF